MSYMRVFDDSLNDWREVHISDMVPQGNKALTPSRGSKTQVQLDSSSELAEADPARRMVILHEVGADLYIGFGASVTESAGGYEVRWPSGSSPLIITGKEAEMAIHVMSSSAKKDLSYSLWVEL